MLGVSIRTDVNKSGPGAVWTKLNQGDIIHRPPSESSCPEEWGFIVTADCDIAQDKAGAKLSYLEIVTACHFLDHVWSGEMLRKLRRDLLKEATALLSKAARQLDSSYDALTSADLLTWLTDSSPAEIVAALELPPKKQAQHLEALERVELAHGMRGDGMTPFQRLRRIWTTQKLAESTIRARLNQALDYNRATDFHLIPSIPGSDQLGFVVLLREVSSIPQSSIVASALDHQIAGDPTRFYVAGPSTDNLRFAISQKMAFLFSRIGMSEDYEDQCDLVTQIAVEEMLSRPDNKGTEV